MLHVACSKDLVLTMHVAMLHVVKFLFCKIHVADSQYSRVKNYIDIFICILHLYDFHTDENYGVYL